MPQEFDPSDAYFRIQITGVEETFPSLLDLSSFLYDINLLYEIARLATDPSYENYRFSHIVYYRNGRRLANRDRLRVESLTQKSPVTLVVVLVATPVAVGAVLGIVQIVEKVSNFRLNRRKLKAEVEKVERENREAVESPYAVIPESDEQVRSMLRVREAEQFFDNVAGRLERSSVRVKELEVEIIQPKRKT